MQKSSKLTHTLTKEQQQLLKHAIKKLQDTLEFETWIENNRLGGGEMTIDYVKRYIVTYLYIYTFYINTVMNKFTHD